MATRYEKYKGTRFHARKLIAEEVCEIRKLHKKGYSQNKLAKAFCVTQGTIHQIVHRATWKNI